MLRLAAPLLVAVLVLLPNAVSARWSATASGAVTVSATTMTNASDLTAACAGKPNIPVAIAWAATPDVFVDHYVIVRTRENDASRSVVQVPRTTTSYSDSPPRPNGRAEPNVYSYTIRAGSAAHKWTTPTLMAITKVTLTSSSCSTA